MTASVVCLVLVDDCYRGVIEDTGMMYKFINQTDLGFQVNYMCTLKQCVELCSFMGVEKCVGINYRVDNTKSSEASKCYLPFYILYCCVTREIYITVCFKLFI